MSASDEISINVRFCSLCEKLLNGVDEDAIPALSQELDGIACDLAKDEELRYVSDKFLPERRCSIFM